MNTEYKNVSKMSIFFKCKHYLKQKKTLIRDYEKAEGLVKELLSEWDDNSDSIKDGTWEVANTVIATIIAETLRNTNNDDGKSEVQEFIEALPSILGVVNAVKSGAQLASDKADREGYLFSLNTAVAALDKIILENQTAFDAYETEYDVYVKEAQDHAGGMVREPNHSSSGDYSAYTALTLKKIKDMVKHEEAWDRDPKKNDLKFWYHIDVLKETSQPSKFSFALFENFDGFWELASLPKKYKCGGGCGLTYETPVENMVVCPYPLTESTLVLDGKTLSGLPVDVALEGKSAPIGCGDLFYLCSKKDRAEHCIRKCGKLLDDGTTCGALYRNCTNIEFNHKGFWNSYHGPGGVTTYPWEGLFNALPGGSHKSVLTALEPHSWIDWYVASSGVSGRGDLIETDYGDGVSMSSEFTYTFASDASGDYVITAVVYKYSDLSLMGEASYTVSVSLPGSTPPTVSLPVWSDIPDPYNLTVGDSFNLDLSSYVTGSPTLTRTAGRIPAGLSFNSGVLSGTVTTVESPSVEFEATNSAGTAKSEWIEFRISAAAPAVFRPSLSFRYNSSTGSVSMTATASEPIYGAHLYVRFPGDTSRYGTKIRWNPANSNRTTYALPVIYTLPSPPASGRYKFTLRVYPFNNSGSGNAWGNPYDVFRFVTVQ